MNQIWFSCHETFIGQRVFDKGLNSDQAAFDIFADQDTPEKMYDKAGLNCSSIIEKIEEALKSNIIFAKNKNKFS